MFCQGKRVFAQTGAETPCRHRGPLIGLLIYNTLVALGLLIGHATLFLITRLGQACAILGDYRGLYGDAASPLFEIVRLSTCGQIGANAKGGENSN